MPGGPYRIAAQGRALGIGLEGSHEITLHAVAKRNSVDSPYCVGNELIAGEIGRSLRLPVPPCGIIHAPDSEPPFWFASLNFNLLDDALPPVAPKECVRVLPDVCTGILLFDLWIANRDRHAGNLSLDSISKPARINLFDHGMALFGSVEGEGIKRLKSDKDQLVINRHCLLRHLPVDHYFAKWIDRIHLLPDYFIDEVCMEAVGLGVTEEEAHAAIDFLKHRRDNILTLIGRHRAAFSGIQTWSLFV